MPSNSIFARLRHSEIALPLIVGFLARLAMFPLAHLRYPKLWEYGDIARYLASGKGYSFHWGYGGQDLVLPTAFMPPGEVLLQFLGLGIFGDTITGHAFIFLEQVAIGTIFIYAMWRILGLLGFSERVRRIGAWLAAIYPSFVLATSSFGVMTAVITLDALLFWSLLSFSSKLRAGQPALRSALATGVLAGILTLFRSESYPLLLATAIIVVWQHRSVPRLAANLSFGAVAFLLIVTPWIVRNYVVFHRFIPTSTTGGFNFWRGHNRDASGSSWTAEGKSIWTTDSMWSEIEPAMQVDSNVEFTEDAYHLKKAKEWIAAHPQIEVERTLRKGALLWGIDWYSEDARKPAYILLYALTVISAIAGIIRIRKEKLRSSPIIKDGTNIIALWCVFYTVVAMTFFSLPRLQIILIAFYFPIVIYGTDWMIGKILPSRKKSLTH